MAGSGVMAYVFICALLSFGIVATIKLRPWKTRFRPNTRLDRVTIWFHYLLSWWVVGISSAVLIILLVSDLRPSPEHMPPAEPAAERELH